MLKVIIIIIILILFIPIVMSLHAFYDNNYNIKKSKKIIKKYTDLDFPEIEKSDKINKTIYQTYKNIDLVPKQYIENIKKNNPGWRYEFYDDIRERNFLKNNFSKDFLDKFDSFKSGAHKADLWRLCMLYLYGGFYFDIDVVLYENLDNIISKKENDLIIAKTFKKEGYFYTIDRLFNALIFCKAGDPLIRKCIINIMKIENSDLKNNYLLILYVMQETLGKDFKYEILENYIFKYSKYTFKKHFIYDLNKNIIGESKRQDYV